LQVFYMDVVYVCNGFKCFLCVFASVSYACFKCFIYLQTNVASEYFKTRLGVSHVAMHVRSGGDASGPRAQTGGAGTAWARETHAQEGVLFFLCECQHGLLVRAREIAARGLDVSLGSNVRALVVLFCKARDEQLYQHIFLHVYSYT